MIPTRGANDIMYILVDQTPTELAVFRMSYRADGRNSAMEVHVVWFGYKRDAPTG
jgi:hypothetical protein